MKLRISRDDDGFVSYRKVGCAKTFVCQHILANNQPRNAQQETTWPAENHMIHEESRHPSEELNFQQEPKHNGPRNSHSHQSTTSLTEASTRHEEGS